jgi:predicted P-loop ATPase
MPISREVTPDEYVAISRQVAGVLGIELFDGTTFETNRLMFWPSNPKDITYYSEVQDGQWLDADEILDMYADWRDSSLWPTTKGEVEQVRDASKKQQDPEVKRGIIGAFCRTHTITSLMESVLQEMYKPAGEGRYTYAHGTAAAGLVVYDDKFAYSHHGTDPTGGKLCNAFDLARIHLFGHLDTDPIKGGTKSKSFIAMEDFARTDPEVRGTIANENFANAKYDFAEEIKEPVSIEWVKTLDVNGRGKYLSTAVNINSIFANDTHIKKLFRQNEFDGKRYVFGNLPWRIIEEPESIKNVDYAGVRNYVESIYGVSGNTKIDDALALEFEKYSFHPVRDYLKSVNWDGVSRVDTILIDYLGARDDIYSRAAIRKMMVGAVARIFEPGVKFDLVLTLVGAQAAGKSTLVKKLGRQWFSDTFMTVQGKEALEQIQGAWIIEMAELSGIRKAEVEAVKHFISKQEDSFRPAYARASESYMRQCIFVGTTNKGAFLSDPSGNRRFLPVDVYRKRATKDIFSTEFDENVDQFWAEAVELYKKGEKLYLDGEAEGIAKREQMNHSEADERTGLVEQYLERRLPANWEDMDIYERTVHLGKPSDLGDVNWRQNVCVAEVWCECLGKEKTDMSRYNSRDINDILRGLEDWEVVNSTKDFAIYGKQKYYTRKLD